MADRKITDLTALAAGSQATGDLLTIVDVSEGAAADKNKKITVESLFKGIPGDVGIGTASPVANTPLTLQGPSGYTDTLWLKSIGTNIDSRINFGPTGTGNAQINNATGTDIAFQVSGSEKLRIDNSGNVGIGTASPGQLLQVGVPNSATGSFRAGTSFVSIDAGFQSSNVIGTAAAPALIFGGDSNTGYWHPASDTLAVSTAGSERMRIDSSGQLILLGSNGSTTNSLDLNYNGSSGQAQINADSGGGNTFLTFGTSSSGSLGERLRIDSSGRVLIGTSSARQNFYNTSSATPFQLEGTSFTSASMALVRNSNNASDAEFIIGKTRSGSVGGAGAVQSGDHLGAISFQGADGSELVEAVSILAVVDGTPGSNDMPGRLQFSTTADGASSPTERMRIDSFGNSIQYSTGTLNRQHRQQSSSVYTATNIRSVISGATGYLAFDTGTNWTNGNAVERMRITSGGALCVNTTTNTGSTKFCVSADTTSANPMSVVNTRTTAGTDYSIIFYRAGSIVGSVQTSLSSTSYLTSSDYRLKENVVDLDGAIARVKQLQPRRFNFIADADITVDGFVAHEAQAVVPEAVTGTHNEVDDDGNAVMQGIDQSKLVPLLTAALQEAIAEIETLKTKVAALEAG